MDAGTAVANSGVKDAPAACSSSYRLPSRGRKQPRPEHFIPEEAEARAHAKAHRSNIVLDRFLSSPIHGSPEHRPQWVRDVTAADVAGGDRERRTERFKIRRLKAAFGRSKGKATTTSDRSSSARPERAMSSAMASEDEDPEEPDGSGTVFSVLAILGASLALSVVSCVLFYIVGQKKQKM